MNNEIMLSVREVTEGNFKLFYTASVPNVKGEHLSVLEDTTLLSFAPESPLDGEEIVVRVLCDDKIAWRFAHEGEEDFRPVEVDDAGLACYR